MFGTIVIGALDSPWFWKRFDLKLDFERHVSLLVVPSCVFHDVTSICWLSNFYQLHVNFLRSYHLDMQLILILGTIHLRYKLRAKLSHTLVYCRLQILRRRYERARKLLLRCLLSGIRRLNPILRLLNFYFLLLWYCCWQAVWMTAWFSWTW
jgi:hypothetical protein